MTPFVVQQAALAAATGDSKQAKALLAKLAETCRGQVVKNVLSASHRGMPFELRMLATNPPGFTVSVPCRNVGHLAISRRTGFDRLLEGLFPRLEFSALDRRFDQDHVVETQQLSLARILLARRPTRDAARAVLSHGASRAQISGARVTASGLQKALGSPPDPDRVLQMVAPLHELAAAVARYARSHDTPPPRGRNVRVALCAVLIGLAGAAGLAASIANHEVFPTVQPGPMALAGFGAGLVLAFLCVPAIARLLRRRTAPHRVVFPLALGALVAVPTCTHGAVSLANVHLCGSAPTVRTLTVRWRTSYSDKNGRMHYRACVDAWWTTGRSHCLPVPADAWGRAVPHRTRAVVTTRQGLFGFEWIDDQYLVEQSLSPGPAADGPHRRQGALQ